MSTNKFLVYITNMIAAILLIYSCGCASTDFHAENNISWVNYVTESQSITNRTQAAESSAEYAKLHTDINSISNIITELDLLMYNFSELTAAISISDRKYFTEGENSRAELLLFRFTKLHSELQKILDYYRNKAYSNEESRTQGAAVFMYAIVNLNYYKSRFVALSINNKKVIKLLNASHSKYNIKKRSYNDIFMNTTDIATIKLIDTSWKLFEKELYTNDSHLSELSRSNPDFNFLHRLKPKYFDSYVQTRYILYASGRMFANVENRIRHTRTREISDYTTALAGSSLYKIQGSVYKNVARIKNPRIHSVDFSDKQIANIKQILRPGDIILTYTAGYMSNIFLPGKFKHGITYIGTVSQRTEAGLVADKIKRYVPLPQQLPLLTNNLQIAEQPAGYEANVIEAVAEGVIINSLDYLLKTHINRMLILRPKISQQERIEMLVDLFLNIGVPYDFNFDFSDDSYQCCTELIYRALNSKGNINMQFSKLQGKWVLSADNIADYCLQSPNTFEVILLAENSNIDNRAEIITGSKTRARLQRLMQQ